MNLKGCQNLQETNTKDTGQNGTPSTHQFSTNKKELLSYTVIKSDG